MIPEKDLKYWIDKHLNVLLVGLAGVGKTSIIKQAFEEKGWNWLYFSAATMDPWVDFVGIPKEKHENGIDYLELVRPRAFAEDKIDAIFFDEFNRAPKKVRNAAMELIQFKSINGKKFNNLKVIWAAINPSDDESTFDVEELDPAQKDRFHVQFEIPYKINKEYFESKFGKQITVAAISWWKNLSHEEKLLVSPRRMEHVLTAFLDGGELKYFFDKKINHKKLILELTSGPIVEKAIDLFKTKNEEDSKKFIKTENNYAGCEREFEKNKDLLFWFLPFMSQEKIVSKMTSDDKVRKFVFKNYESYKEIISEVSKSKGPISAECKNLIKERETVGKLGYSASLKKIGVTLGGLKEVVLKNGSSSSANIFIKEYEKYQQRGTQISIKISKLFSPYMFNEIVKLKDEELAFCSILLFNELLKMQVSTVVRKSLPFKKETRKLVLRLISIEQTQSFPDIHKEIEEMNRVFMGDYKW